ncbi:methylthioribulose 1-phosphate dehydratase [Thermoactinomyces sp. CICC 24226]|nr:methylthioribulose-1-phosphate dehydratase [Thermoactinomyces sp. AS95]MBH8584273.1 methylthioribulose 1-phosphate dehydratase [Thermoactinomyces sp. CICC 10735]MBI0392331.1 methylthioribulose 1-phosphate dehydratase [Thermoactinomyces sp. CICC 24226]
MGGASNLTRLEHPERIRVEMEKVEEAFHELRKVKELFAGRGWFPATSGNLSVRVDVQEGEPDLIAITASGKDKTVHTPEDFLLVNKEGKPAFPTCLKPSAETLVHTAIYQKIKESRAIFHIHTVHNNLISEQCGDSGYVSFSGHEIIKALNIWEEGAVIRLPVVPNHASIPDLAQAVREVIDPQVPAVLIRNHGIYAWGDSVFAAKRHLEAFEFLFEYQVKLQLLNS